MKNAFCESFIYPAILLLLVGTAYYGGKSDWLRLEKPALPPVIRQGTSAPKSVHLARPQKVLTLDEVKSKFADLLGGNWPASAKTSTDQRNFIRGFVRSSEFDPKDVPDLIAMLHDAPESAEQQMMISELLGRISGNTPRGLNGANPALALKLMDNLSDPVLRRQILDGALALMAEDDPRSAWNELNQLPPGTASPEVYTAIFAGFAKQDPVAAAAAVADLPPGLEQDDALKGVAQGWLKSDPQAAMNWASNLTPPNVNLVNSMIQSLAGTNPALAVPYVNKITYDSARNDTIATIGRKLATGPNADPSAALAWFNQAAKGSAYQDDVVTLLGGLAKPSAQEWIDANGTQYSLNSGYMQNTSLAISLLANVTDPSAQKAAITSIAGGWAISDPQAALAWAQTLPVSQPTARSDALDTIVTTWSKTDPAAAVAFVQNSTDSSVYLPIAPALAQNMAAVNPQAAFSFAQSLPAGDSQTQALSNVLDGLAGSNFTTAWTDVNNLPQGDSQNTIMANLVATEAQKDPAQAAAAISQIPDAAAQVGATSSLASTWIKLDPQAFAAWLDQQPSGDNRDAAIAQLVSSTQSTKNPVGVLQWVNTVSNPQTKAALLQQLSQTYATKTP